MPMDYTTMSANEIAKALPQSVLYGANDPDGLGETDEAANANMQADQGLAGRNDLTSGESDGTEALE
jgi:hypothetical protein